MSSAGRAEAEGAVGTGPEPVLLEAAGLEKIYRHGSREVRAVDGIDLRLKKGGFLAIVGPSGAGKSTLLHLLGGLDRPTGGTVAVDGVSLYGISESKRADFRNRTVGFVFQFYHLLPEFTALENVLLPSRMRRMRHRERRAARERAGHLLETVGLKERSDHRPSELSGGECQRVAIARALINEPALLLCDEPTGNLDSRTGGAIMALLAGINRGKNLSLVVATHDESVKALAHAVAHLKDGKVLR